MKKRFRGVAPRGYWHTQAIKAAKAPQRIKFFKRPEQRPEWSAENVEHQRHRRNRSVTLAKVHLP